MHFKCKCVIILSLVLSRWLFCVVPCFYEVAVWFLQSRGLSTPHCTAQHILCCLFCLSFCFFLVGVVTFFFVHLCWFESSNWKLSWDKLDVLRAFLMYVFFFFPFWLKGNVSARCYRILITPSFCCRGWYKSKSRYWSMCISFQQSSMLRLRPSLETSGRDEAVVGTD